MSDRDAFPMSAMCGGCGTPYGKHNGILCPDKGGTFRLADGAKITPEVFRKAPIDASRAMDAVRSMCGGGKK